MCEECGAPPPRCVVCGTSADALIVLGAASEFTCVEHFAEVSKRVRYMAVAPLN